MSAFFWIFFILTLTAFDALRDLLRGQVDYTTFHVIKWLQFYPMLAYFWFKKLGAFNVQGVLVRCLVVLLALAIWNTLAFFYAPPHWERPATPFWLRWLL